MKVFIDNSLIQKMKAHEAEAGHDVLLKTLIKANFLTSDQSVQVLFGWPSLLEYLDLGSLFEQFRPFDRQHELFGFITTVLTSHLDKDLLVRLYDQIFAECLTHIKALPQIQASFLMDCIREKRQSFASSFANQLFSASLDRYETAFAVNPSYTMHDLILYLAWDRICVDIATVFELVSPDLNVQNDLKVFKDCLLESFQHITAHGRTAPGFFRLLETLYAYQMREEFLQTYTEDEWLTLCQSSEALKPREGLMDVFYIDAAVVENREMKEFNKERDLVRVLTLDPVDKVQASLSLADYMIGKLKQEESEWRYALCPVEIVCLREAGSNFLINKVIRHPE
jgi:hypothetical protein